MIDKTGQDGRPPRQGGGGKPYAAEGERKPRRDYTATHAKNQPRTVERAEDEARIAKVMARAGLCSRRDAEAWIVQGRVAVNGTLLKSAAFNVGPDDRVVVDGVSLEARERTRLFLFHKPRGLVTTQKDPEGRETIFDALPEDLPRVVSVGRLDINTEGLMLLTNDGGLARVLELPATGWLRRYRVRAKGEIDQATLDGLREGISIEGVDYAGIEATFDRVQGANVWLTMGLREGKNREIKRVLEHLGLAVNRLIRVSFGPFQLADLAEGAVEEVRGRVLRDQLGPALAAEAKVDFEGPVTAPIVTEEVRAVQREVKRQERANPAAAAGHGAPKKGRGADRGVDRDAGRPSSRIPRAPIVEERPRLIKPVRGPHKHVSASRAEAAEPDEGRRRITRAATADRKGRAVTVERVSLSKPASERTLSRNGRRFAQEVRDDTTPARQQPRQRVVEVDPPFRKGRPPREARNAERTERSARPQAAGQLRVSRPGADALERPRRERPQGERPQGARPQGARPQGERPRGDRPYGDRPQGERPRADRYQGDRSRSERPDKRGGERPRPQGGERPRPQSGERPRPQSGERPRPQSGERPRPQSGERQRPQGGEGRLARPEREGDKRPDRARSGPPRSARPDGAPARGDRPRGDRPRGDQPRGDRPFGDKPFGGKPRGDRPEGGKPRGSYGKPGGKPAGRDSRPGGSRPGGGPSGDRPGGGQPGGNRPGGGRPNRKPGDRPPRRDG